MRGIGKNFSLFKLNDVNAIKVTDITPFGEPVVHYYDKQVHVFLGSYKVSGCIVRLITDDPEECITLDTLVNFKNKER